MSFFDNRVRLGSAIWAMGVLQMATGLSTILLGIAGVGSPVRDSLLGVGAILSSVVLIGLGAGIRMGVFRTKWDILCRILMANVLNIIINGVFNYAVTATMQIAALLTVLVIAVVMYLVYKKIVSGNITFMSKVLYYFIFILYILLILFDIYRLSDFLLGTLGAVCGFIVEGYVILTLREPAIRAKFGIGLKTA